MFILIQRIFGVFIVAAFTLLVANGVFRVFVLPDLMKLEPDQLKTYSLILGCLTAALTGWLRWRHYQKADLRAARPGPPPLPARGMSQGFVWTMVLLIGLPFSYAVIKNVAKDYSRPAQPGHQAFTAANMLIVGKSNGIAHGNTALAESLARIFSKTLKEAREMGVEGRKAPAIATLTGGEFLTYCLITPESCVFMVHVPDLRKFTPEAKDFIAEAAWRTGLAITRTGQPGLRKLCVGVRGALLYDRVIHGSSGNAPGADSMSPAEVKGNSEAVEVLERYFAPTAPLPAVATVSPSNLNP